MTTKPFKNYDELVQLLIDRQMLVSDRDYAIKKLMQVGYYRLSGFWHISRQADTRGRLIDVFLPDTDFHQVYRLYIFDKKCRLMVFDIVERLEIILRSVIAHEMARIDTLAYVDEFYINPKHTQHYQDWQKRLDEKIKKSKDDFVLWHQSQNKPLPFWAVVELWDFGMLSKYFSMLKKRYQNIITQRLGLENTAILINWLNEINIIRNQSAHYSRIWNKKYNPIKLPKIAYFEQFNFTDEHKKRLFPRLVVLWYLVALYSHHYHWNIDMAMMIDKHFPVLPNAKLKSMGIEAHHLSLFQTVAI